MKPNAETRAAIVHVARHDLADFAPAGQWERIVARRNAGERRILPVAPVGASAHKTSTARRVATILLGLGAAAAAMVAPPIQRWVGHDVRHATAPPVAVKRKATAPAGHALPDVLVPVTEAARVSGVSIPLAASRGSVSVIDSKGALRIRVRLVPTDQLEVRGVGEASEATFRPTDDEISVVGAKAGEVQVDVPAVTDQFTLRVNGAVYMIKSGTSIRLLTRPSDSTAREFIFAVRHDSLHVDPRRK